MTNSANKPVTTLRDGAIKATIWKNEGENGAFYTVSFSRTYTDDAGNAQSADGFSGSQLLKLSRIAQKAYDRTSQLREADKEAEQEAA